MSCTDQNHTDEATTTKLDEIYDIYCLGDLFTAVFQDSDYRFGCLHFAEPMGDGEYPDYIAEPPDFMKRGWTRYHEVPMVLHPNKGALLMYPAGLSHDDQPEKLTENIEEEHSALVRLEWKIRNRLETVGYWKDRPIVMGAGVVTSHHVPDALRPDHLPEVAIIDRDKLPTFVTHVDALFEHYTTDAARPVAEWGERLVADITGSDFLGGFVGEQNHIESYDRWGRELDGLVEKAA
jgi:hypothetical protein